MEIPLERIRKQIGDGYAESTMWKIVSENIYKENRGGGRNK
jgi:hypothetical protein